MRDCKVGSTASNICTLLALIVLARSKACNEKVTDGVSSECIRGRDVSVSQWRIAFLHPGMWSGTWQHDMEGNSSQGVAIQSHVLQHRKHSAVYRKCLMKECCGCLNSVSGDDFS